MTIDVYRGIGVHEYKPDQYGICTSGWFNSSMKWIPCRSTQSYSVLHYNEEAEHRQQHYHDGGDCMCHEAEADSYHDN